MTTAQKVLKALGKVPVTSICVAHDAGISSTAARTHLRRLVDEGRVEETTVECKVNCFGSHVWKPLQAWRKRR